MAPAGSAAPDGFGGPGGFGAPGGPGGGPGGFGGVPGGPPPGPPPSSGGGSNRRGLVWAVVALVVALAVGAGVLVAVSGDDDGDEADSTEPVDTDAPDTTQEAVVTTTTTAPTTTTEAPATTIAPTLPTLPALTTAPETVPVAPGAVDLGHGVSFALPEGYTDSPSSTGSSHQLENGTISAFFQVLEREPGESVLALLQEYVDTFDTDFDSVVYSQVIPSTGSDAGQAPSDGDAVYYHALNADGTGVRGLIEAHRRADGLAFVSDIFRDIDDDSEELFPEASLDEIYDSYEAAPLVGDTADLEPPTFTRLTSAHPSYTIDGLVAVTPPPGWTVDSPVPAA